MATQLEKMVFAAVFSARFARCRSDSDRQAAAKNGISAVQLLRDVDRLEIWGHDDPATTLFNELMEDDDAL